jgi:hypothetical protein
MTRAEEIIIELGLRDGQSDRELTQSIFGNGYRVQQINSECRYMHDCGRLDRRLRDDGIIGNFLRRPRPELRLV